MPIQLRDYQYDVVDSGRQLVSVGRKKIIFQMSTGAGKTAVGAHVLERATSKGAHAHFWVHRRELLKQSVLAMDKAGVECGIIAAGFPARPSAPVQVCSIQSLPRRLPTIRKPNIIIVDECHHSASSTWSKLIEYYADAVVIGLTATPWRLDGSGLGKWYTDMVLGPSTQELIEQGWLSRYRLFCPTQIKTETLHSMAGEYNPKEVDELMKASPVVGDAIHHYKKYVMGKRAVMFLWSIESSVEMTAKLNAMGIPAAHIDGTTPEAQRDQALRDFAAGRIWVLCNVDLISEGLDIPSIEALFMLRPTKSLSRFLQMVGRAMRPSEGKTHAFIFDHANNVRNRDGSRNHGLPDDPQDWTLEGKKKKKKNADEERVSFRFCPVCREVSPLYVRICPCGHKLVIERQIEVDAQSELEELDPATVRRQQLLEQGRADSIDKLIELGQRKGYKHPELWARHVHTAREQKKQAKERQRLESTLPAEALLPEKQSASLDPWAF